MILPVKEYSGKEIRDNEEDKIAADAKEWTVFDDFRLLFAAKGVDTDLVLDEDAPNLDYLKECSNTYQNAILHLNKTIQTNVWTSIILPVNLTKNQFTTAFGANARLAELKNVVDTEIRFATRNLQDMKDEDVALVAYKPYILYSTEVNKTTPVFSNFLLNFLRALSMFSPSLTGTIISIFFFCFLNYFCKLG